MPYIRVAAKPWPSLRLHTLATECLLIIVGNRLIAGILQELADTLYHSASTVLREPTFQNLRCR